LFAALALDRNTSIKRRVGAEIVDTSQSDVRRPAVELLVNWPAQSNFKLL
jgi:hypothetical protein